MDFILKMKKNALDIQWSTRTAARTRSKKEKENKKSFGKQGGKNKMKEKWVIKESGSQG